MKKRFRALSAKGLVQGFSDISFGSISPSKDKEKSEQRAINFLKSISRENFSPSSLVFAKQVFGSKVHLCQKQDSGKIIKNVDGFVSNIPGQILGITTADCLPVFLFDQKNKAVGLLHASRESLTKGIIKNAIEKMVFDFKSQAGEILVAIGPHIRKCHYWLREKTYQGLKNSQFEKYFIFKNKKTYFDLTRLAFEDLLKSGIKRKNIEDCAICTFCSYRKYFSARKKEENPKIYPEKKPTFINFIGLENEDS